MHAHNVSQLFLEWGLGCTECECSWGNGWEKEFVISYKSESYNTYHVQWFAVPNTVGFPL